MAPQLRFRTRLTVVSISSGIFSPPPVRNGFKKRFAEVSFLSAFAMFAPSLSW